MRELTDVLGVDLDGTEGCTHGPVPEPPAGPVRVTVRAGAPHSTLTAHSSAATATHPAATTARRRQRAGRASSRGGRGPKVSVRRMGALHAAGAGLHGRPTVSGGPRLAGPGRRRRPRRSGGGDRGPSPARPCRRGVRDPAPGRSTRRPPPRRARSRSAPRNRRPPGSRRRCVGPGGAPSRSSGARYSAVPASWPPDSCPSTRATIEVSQERPAVRREQDVGGLDVAVDDAPPVRGDSASAIGTANRHHLTGREPAPLRQHGVERTTGGELHDDRHPLAVLHHFDDSDDVRWSSSASTAASRSRRARPSRPPAAPRSRFSATIRGAGRPRYAFQTAPVEPMPIRAQSS
jgi:hypothetical protein